MTEQPPQQLSVDVELLRNAFIELSSTYAEQLKTKEMDLALARAQVHALQQELHQLKAKEPDAEQEE